MLATLARRSIAAAALACLRSAYGACPHARNRSTISTPRPRAKARSHSMSAARPRPGKRAQRYSRSAIPASRSRSAAASPTCSTRRSMRRSPPENSRSMPRSCRPPPTMCAGRTRGRLIAFKPPGFDKMDANFKDADGTFWATMVNVVPYMYNTEKVAAADIPNSAIDFLKAPVPGQDRHRLSGRRRRHAVGVLPHRAEIRLGLHGQIHGGQAELHPGPSRRTAQHRLRAKPRHLRLHSRHHQ